MEQYFINKIYLENFRNHVAKKIEFCNGINAIIGKNGSGKTSILEAISLLYPGRGIRSSNSDLMINNKSQVQFWHICAEIEQLFSKNIISVEYKNRKKTIFINDNKTKPNSQNIHITWLSPQISYQVISCMSKRRKFIDRITYLFHPSHAKDVNQYEKALQERNKLLFDENIEWLNAIEKELSKYGAKITLNRESTIKLINKISTENNEGIYIEMEKVYKNIENKKISQELFIDLLKNSRKNDKTIKRTTVGPHCIKINIFNELKKMPIEVSSLGEQKLILSKITMIQIIAKKELTNITPILLLDDITNQLDAINSRTLIEQLKNIKCQVILTNTSGKDYYENNLQI